MNLQDILNQQDIWRVSRAYQRAKVAESRAGNTSNISSRGATFKGPSQEAFGSSEPVAVAPHKGSNAT